MSKKASSAAPGGGAPRVSKREQLRAERRRRSLLWNLILLGGGALVIAVVVWYVIANARPGSFPSELSAPGDFPNEGAGHIVSRNADGAFSGSRPTYQHYPPSSGTHYGDLVAPWGIYTQDNPFPMPEGVVDPEGIFVHNLEHGGVVFLYACPDECPELEQQFLDLYENTPLDVTFNSKKVLALPYDQEKMPTQIVALAWTHQWNTDTFDETQFINWYRRFVNKGPELVR